MQRLFTNDTTSLSYWLHWRVLVCAIWVFSPIVAAVYMIWKYESLDKLASRRGKSGEETALLSQDDEAWRPCLKQIHPVWLLAYRVLAFSFLMVLLIKKVSASGIQIYYFYTQWSFTLLTIYFGFGSVLSVYGCHRHFKMASTESNLHHNQADAEQGCRVPLIFDNGTDVLKVSANQEEIFVDKIPSIPCFLFQVMFQMTAGAVALTDTVYWCILFPYFTIKEYSINFTTVSMHSLNAVLLLGDTALNSLPLPWFGISYFMLWTAAYVIFQWTIHAFRSIWWPYPFLDLSSPYAPLWYLLMASLHVACYGIFVLIVKLKHDLLSRWFPQSYWSLR